MTEEAGRGPALREPANCEMALGLRPLDRPQAGEAVWRMTTAEYMANPAGIVQGGFISAFTESAMADSVTSNQAARGGGRPSAAEMKVTFVRATPVGVELTCTARVVGGGRRVNFAEAEVTDGTGAVVARASATYLLGPGA